MDHSDLLTNNSDWVVIWERVEVAVQVPPDIIQAVKEKESTINGRHKTFTTSSFKTEQQEPDSGTWKMPLLLRAAVPMQTTLLAFGKGFTKLMFS